MVNDIGRINNMELEDVRFVRLDKAKDIIYTDRRHGRCVVICSRPDDGACLIIELVDGKNEPSDQYRSSEACYLTKACFQYGV